jgi:periplasmic divalent cation tolerance protein
MRRGSKFRIVLVTGGSTAEARKIAKAVVEKRLAACVNIIGREVESIYWWKGKVESGRERLLMMKTSAERVKELEKEVRRMHSYEVPEFLVMEVEGGSKEYLKWLGETLG